MKPCIEHSKLNTIFIKTLFLSLLLAFQSLDTNGQRITTIAGSFGDGKPAIQAQLYAPTGVAIDNQGNVFIADADSRLVRKIDAITGVMSTVAGNGDTGSDGDGGLAVNAQLSNPYEITIDGASNLYISDQSAHCVRKVDLLTGLISTVAGVNRAWGFSGDGGLAIEAKLAGPTSVCFDAPGNIYVCDLGNHRIRKIEKTTGIITTIVGTGVSGFSGDGGLATSAQLSYPTDVAIDSDGNLLITDRDNHRIRKVNLTTNVISTVAGIGTSGFSGENGLATSAQLNLPLKLVVDPDGNVYFSDTNNERIRKIDHQTGIITTVAGNGIRGFSGDTGLATSAQLASPQGLGIDSNGNIFIAEYLNRRIRKVTAGGTISTVGGNGGFGGDGGLAIEATLNNPRGAAFDSNGNLFLVDKQNNRIRKIDHLTGIITTIAGAGDQGFSGDNGQAINAKLYWPRFLVLDANDNIYFTDGQNFRVRRIDSSSGIITTVAGNGNFGFNGDGILAINASLSQPDGIAIDENGDVYFSDTFNNRIRKISVGSGLITTILGNGTQGFAGDNGIAISAATNYPAGIAIRSGNLYVADQSNNRIRKVDLLSNIVTTVVGGGNVQNDNVLATDYLLAFPSAVTFDPNGNLVIVTNYQKVHLVDKTSNLIKTIVGNGSYGFSGDNGSAPSAKLRYPSAIVYDATGNLFISDTENNRIRRVAVQNSQTVTFNPLPSVALGDAPFAISASNAFSSTGLPITFSSSNASIATVVGNTVTIVGAGTINITAIQAGDIDHAPANAQQTLLVNKGNPIVTIISKASGANGSSITLTATKGGSSGAISYSVANGTGSAIIIGDVLSLTGTGTVTVTAIVAPDNNYNQGTTTQQVTIEKTVPIISFSIPSNGIVGTNLTLSINKGGSAGAVTYSIVGGTATATITANTLAPTGPGTILIKASVAEDANFIGNEIIQALTINLGDTMPIGAQFWGVTSGGGLGNVGVIFKTKSDGSELTVQHEFTTSSTGYPYIWAEMMRASNGKMYGVAAGGIFNQGVLFEFDPSSATYIKLHDFFGVNGANPNGRLAEANNGKLYGTTGSGGVNGNGILFEFDPQTKTFAKKFDFAKLTSGSNPQGLIANASGAKLYGTAANGGTFGGVLFEYEPAQNSLVSKIHFEAQTGVFPAGSLLVSTSGKIYGLLQSGGQNNYGVLYEFNPSDDSFAKLHDFTNQESGGYLTGTLSQALNGNLYGSIQFGGQFNGGSIFEYNLSTNTYSKKFDLSYATGTSPNRMTSGTNGNLYGTTSGGGSNQGGGVIFEYNPVNNTYTKKIDLGTPSIGGLPGAVTLAASGKFYGMASNGGELNKGTIFEYDPTSNICVSKFNFSYAPGGASPIGTLTPSEDGRLFGISRGGEKNQGVLFEYDPTTNVYLKKHDFIDPLDGKDPIGSLLLMDTKKIVGLAARGGAKGEGIIYEYDLVTNGFAKKIDFDVSTIGGLPNGGLMKASNGKLYGVASGGLNFRGTLFELDPLTYQLTKKFDFETTTNGCGPTGNLVEAPNHKLYGVTSSCGANNVGVLFEYDYSSSTFRKIIDFNGSLIGAYPVGGLVLAPDGLLYGNAGGGVNNNGVLFSFNPVTESITKLFDFSHAVSGSQPQGTMAIGSAGKLYGVTNIGGSSGGVLFELNPATNIVTKKLDLSSSTGKFPSGSLTLIKANQTISFSPVLDKAFGVEPFDLTATSTSGLQVTYMSSNPNVATVSNGKITIVGVGNTTITASQSGDFDYNPAANVQQPLVVNKGAQSISFSALPNKNHGDQPFSLSATTTSGLTISYTSFDETVATISGSMVTIVGAGSTTITAKQAGNLNYNAAADVTQTLIVNKANQTITFNSLAAKTFGDATFTLSAISSSNLPISYISSNESVATISGNTVTIVGAGSTTITAKQAGNLNYNVATDVTQTLVVHKANQTITFNSLAAKTFGDAAFTLSAISSSNLPISYISSNESVATISGNTVTIVGAGSTTITAKQAGNLNYNVATDVTQTLVVHKANQTITFNSLAAKVFGDALFNLSATASSGLPVSYSSSDESIATISGNSVSILGGGTVTITASQAGNANYRTASTATQLLTVKKVNQAITFNSVATKVLGGAPFNLSATSTSGLSIQFSTTSDKVSLSSNQVTMVKPGSVTIKADQTGNSNFDGAVTVSQSFCINPAKPTITSSGLNSGSPILTSSSSTGNQWYKNGTLITEAVSNTFTPIDGGAYSVKVTVDDCSSEISTDQVLVITGDIKSARNAGFFVYPNPTSNTLTINLTAFDAGAEVTIVVYDLSGKVMDQLTKQGEKATISVGSYSTGAYFIKASQRNRTFVVKFEKE